MSMCQDLRDLYEWAPPAAGQRLLLIAEYVYTA